MEEDNMEGELAKKGEDKVKGKLVITIGRQFCSGGKLVGKAVAEKLNIAYYDKKKIANVAREMGYPETIFRKMEDIATNSYLYSLAMGASAGKTVSLEDKSVLTNAELFNIQSEIIKKISSENDCVIVGRCADYVLRENENLVRVFVRADMDYRIDMYEKTQRIPENRSVEYVLEGVDRKKNLYHMFYTGMDWQDLKNYDLIINTAKVGTNTAAEMVVDYVKKYIKKI
jgi:cytidylate kinase